MSHRTLTEEETAVIVRKGTEQSFTGDYVDFKDDGTYICKRCEAPLFHSSAKFNSGTGWPSFDDAIDGAVKQVADSDGARQEIVCAGCGGHLGHVFFGEQFTEKNTRHCVNSISLDFVDQRATRDTRRAIFASGCFWGAEHMFANAGGVISTKVGYIGGPQPEPTYAEVCGGDTGHAEAVEVLYDPTQTTYEELARLFFETHDPTQKGRQGPDVGEQYRSAIFTLDDEQKETAHKLIQALRDKGLDVATEVVEAETFFAAEKGHQKYYERLGGRPYCHFYTERF